MEITEDKGQEIKKHDDNSPYLRGLVVEGLSVLIHIKCLASGLAYRKPTVNEAFIIINQATSISTQQLVGDLPSDS